MTAHALFGYVDRVHVTELAAYIGRHHRGPVYYLITGPTFIAMGISWLVWPQWMAHANDWLVKHFAWTKRSKQEREKREKPLSMPVAMRRARIAGGVVLLVGIAFLVIGIVRVT